MKRLLCFLIGHRGMMITRTFFAEHGRAQACYQCDRCGKHWVTFISFGDSTKVEVGNCNVNHEPRREAVT